MRGIEFLYRVKRVGRERGVKVKHDPRHGKGSHGRIYFGANFTTIPDLKKDIGWGLLLKMLRDLKLTRSDIE